MQPDYNFDGSSKRALWLIGIGSVLALALIAGLLVFFLNKQKQANNPQQETAASLTVGTFPYVYPCSVATITNYESAFGLNDGGNIGYQYEASAFVNAKGDLTQLARQPDPAAGYGSSCAMTIPKSPGATSETSITVTINQFSGTKGANDSLSRDQLAAAANSKNPNATPPSLPSFVTNSVVFKPGALNDTIEASIAHNNVYITLDYPLQDGDTTATATPKLDAFAKTILANADNKAVATKPNSLAGHATFLGTPFVDICRGLDYTKLASIFSGIQFRPDVMTNEGQYGALSNLPAATTGVTNTCGLTFNTSTDRAGFQAFNSSSQAQALQLVNIYPQSLRLSMNTFSTADGAKAAFAAKKAAQKPAAVGPTLQDIPNLGDAAYTYHNQGVFQKSAINQSAGTHQVNYTILQDDYVILNGPRLITISFQQNSETDPYATGPAAITPAQIQSMFQLFKNVLSARGS
ncbi:MAG TPA: hypothetical protein VJR27_00085 [Candidatus Saccharimonadales bacterium]|nr:hypothetical protein [Candidatus Saccharimonadales bacterium]